LAKQTKRVSKPKKTKKRVSAKQKRLKQTKYEWQISGAVFLLIAFFSYLNLGMVGTFFANFFRLFVGDTYRLLLILLAVYAVYLLFTGKGPKLSLRYWLGGGLAYLGIILWMACALFLVRNQHVNFVQVTWALLKADFAQQSVMTAVGGGMIGAYMLAVTNFLVAILGSQLIAILLVVAGVVIAFKIPVSKVFASIGNGLQLIGRAIGQFIQGATKVVGGKASKVTTSKIITKSPKITATKPETTPAKNSEPEVKEKGSLEDSEPNYKITVANQEISKGKLVKQQNNLVKTDKPTTKTDDSEPKIDNESNTDESNYQLPTADLLTAIPQTDQSDEYNAIDKNTKVLKKTLESFGVEAEVKNVSLGPSVTEYELHPAIGVKVSRIVNLADDLALALAAKDIRIEAPIPGKSLIGIEVPNRKISTVSFRDITESIVSQKQGLLEVPLGRDVTGKVVTADLTKMPHLLIAGSTGSGKSVSINGIITSILMKAKPSQVKMMLIDPKKVELSVYNGIPHLLTPVVSEPKKAARALHKVVSEMERRYELFSQYGQRNIKGYNKHVAEFNQTNNPKLPSLPYIVVIVDELADLMMTVSNEVEDAIIRLAQMGRAAGVHMILATQRPSVDVITGLIKANVPSRIAFAVSSGIDSRTILDSNGAEKLLGRGDMLYLPIDQNTPVRVQGAFISDNDVASVVAFIKNEQEADYDDSMIVSDEEIKSEDLQNSEDDLFDDALNFVVDQQKASTSLLQRHFRIGYNRAARMIDDLEQGGFIGPQEGSKPRQVYKQKNNEEE